MLTILKQDTDEIIFENLSDKIVNYISKVCPDVKVSITESTPLKAQVRTMIFTDDYIVHYFENKLMILSTKYKLRLFVVI